MEISIEDYSDKTSLILNTFLLIGAFLLILEKAVRSNYEHGFSTRR